MERCSHGDKEEQNTSLTYLWLLELKVEVIRLVSPQV